MLLFLSENPYESIPGDEDGHGTFVASVICGNDRPQDDFCRCGTTG